MGCDCATPPEGGPHCRYRAQARRTHGPRCLAKPSRPQPPETCFADLFLSRVANMWLTLTIVTPGANTCYSVLTWKHCNTWKNYTSLLSYAPALPEVGGECFFAVFRVLVPPGHCPCETIVWKAGRTGANDKPDLARLRFPGRISFVLKGDFNPQPRDPRALTRPPATARVKPPPDISEQARRHPSPPISRSELFFTP